MTKKSKENGITEVQKYITALENVLNLSDKNQSVDLFFPIPKESIKIDNEIRGANI